jgi:tyrosyl-tRNA synthetase
MVDKVFLRHGCKAVILAGGATSLIGDPGGKDSERPLQDEATIAKNAASVAEQLKQVLVGYDFTPVNNLDWTRDLMIIEFLRDIGKHFSMTPLVQRDFIARRMGEDGAGISYTEFSYTLLQGMDFLHLFDNNGVTLQVGSSDQWGNCLSGVDLIRRARNAEAHVFTHPLIINKATGKKFGKSEEGAVWLDPDKTSPTAFYQFWINADDEGVEEYLKVYTELEKPELEAVMSEHKEDVRKRRAQIKLAEGATELVHGREAMEIAQRVTHIIIGNIPIGEADERHVNELRKELPSAQTANAGSIVEALVGTGLATSNSEGRRLLSENAISINGQKITKENFADSDFQNGRLLLRKGKAFKDSALIELKN